MYIVTLDHVIPIGKFETPEEAKSFISTLKDKRDIMFACEYEEDAEYSYERNTKVSVGAGEYDEHSPFRRPPEDCSFDILNTDMRVHVTIQGLTKGYVTIQGLTKG